MKYFAAIVGDLMFAAFVGPSCVGCTNQRASLYENNAVSHLQPV